MSESYFESRQIPSCKLNARIIRRYSFGCKPSPVLPTLRAP
jgi:hypothetical protein